MTNEHPMQPVELDGLGVPRFRRNAIVKWLFNLKHTSNIFQMDFTDEDKRQLAQLIGYSVGGYSELSYVTDESAAQADKLAEAIRVGDSTATTDELATLRKQNAEWRALLDRTEQELVQQYRDTKLLQAELDARREYMGAEISPSTAGDGVKT